MDEIETFNKFFVSVKQPLQVVILRLPPGPLSPKEALNLAAWLVVSSRAGKEEFDAIYEAVCNS
jgi:hypothetical protein